MIGWGAIGCLLEWASLPNWESGSLLAMIRGLWARLGRGLSALEVSLVLGSASVALVQGLAPVTLGVGFNNLYNLFLQEIAAVKLVSS